MPYQKKKRSPTVKTTLIRCWLEFRSEPLNICIYVISLLLSAHPADFMSKDLLWTPHFNQEGNFSLLSTVPCFYPQHSSLRLANNVISSQPAAESEHRKAGGSVPPSRGRLGRNLRGDHTPHAWI